MPDTGTEQGLLASVDSLDAIPESLRSIYRQDGDGKFVLNVDPESAEATFAAGLKRNRDQLLRDKKRADARLKAFDGLDPDEVREMQDELAILKEELAAVRAKAGGKGKGGSTEDDLQTEIKKVREAITAAKDKEIEERDNQIKQRDDTIARLLVDQEATKELAAADAFNADLLLPHIQRQCVVVNEHGSWRASVRDKDGEERINSQGEPMTIRELVAEMRKNPTYAPGFKGTGSSGSGATGGSTTGGAGGRTIRSLKDFTSDAEKAHWVSEHGYEAFTKLPAE